MTYQLSNNLQHFPQWFDVLLQGEQKFIVADLVLYILIPL